MMRIWEKRRKTSIMSVLIVLLAVTQTVSVSCEGILGVPVNDTEQQEEEKTVYDIMLDKIVSYYMQNPTNEEVESIISKQETSGAYKDLDYNSVAKVYWEPLQHLERLLTLSCAYINKGLGSKWYGNEALYEHINKGLKFYYDTDPTKPEEYYNWYDKKIAEPHLYGKVLLNMKLGIKQLPDSLVLGYIDRWMINGGKPEDMSSANRTDIAMHRLFLSVLKEDPDILHDALFYLFEPIQYATGQEGFQVDNSYTYHKRQFYIGGYSEVLLANVLTVGCWVQGTEFEMNQEKVDFLRRFVLGTFADVIRGRVMLFNALGRSVSREDYLYRTDERTEFMRQMAILDSQHKSEYEAFASRLKGVAPASFMLQQNNSVFFISDYMLHKRLDWTVGIRAVSDRTFRQEVFANNENLLGYFLSDGSTAIGVSGEEYGNIMPLWDWNHIPGVTAPVLSEIPVPDKYVKGKSWFTGGVSDGEYGVFVYSYFDPMPTVDTGAQKGWFALDDELVCIGSAIQGNSQVHTTINQNWGGSFEVGTTDGRYQSINGTGEYKGDAVSFVVHNDIGYFFPKGGHVYAETRKKQGSWFDINVNQSDRTINGDVFKIYLDHQVPNQEQDKWSRNYCYVVCPGMSYEDMASYAQNRHLYIHNTDSIQAVFDEDKEIAQIIFYEPCEFSYNGFIVSTSKPCVMMVRDYLKTPMRVYLADILRDSAPFSVDIKTPKNTGERIDVFLPIAESYKGESKEYVLANNAE